MLLQLQRNCKMSKTSRPSFLPLKRSVLDVVCHYEDAAMALAFPALYELLCHAKRDGNHRAGSRLTFFADTGRLKASIWDPDTAQCWFSTLESADRPWEQVEALLQAQRGEWREVRQSKR
jgi:hypothetical protein